jgi:Fe-S-cluster containining protein
MAFTCRQCGTCCLYLGDYILIERQTGPFEFICESVSTGTVFTAQVDEDKRDIFADTSFSRKHPHACRFLRPDGKYIRCTIHRDSPPQCKYYRCTIMKIRDTTGALLGTVTGTFNLHTENNPLREFWEHHTAGLLDEQIESDMPSILRENGYQVE